MRCNCGVKPKYLTDSWLIAEQVELLMIPGLIRRNNFQTKSVIPNNFTLGKGHMLFWYNKLFYLNKRHDEIKKEVIRRGFKATDSKIQLDEFPKELINDWTPQERDRNILVDRLLFKLNRKPDNWRYKSVKITDINSFQKELINSELYYV